jgi:stage V sporulation protein R
MDMYVFAKQGNDWTITEKSWELVRDQLVNSKVNGGYPYLLVKDGDYLRNGELYIYHQYETIELDIKYLEKTMPFIYFLWGKSIHVETMIEQRKVLFTYDGKKCHRRFL